VDEKGEWTIGMEWNGMKNGGGGENGKERYKYWIKTQDKERDDYMYICYRIHWIIEAHSLVHPPFNSFPSPLSVQLPLA
jgi:hypothetical protein